MSVHLLDPKSDLGRCGSRAPGERVDRWRRNVTCRMCLAITGPRAADMVSNTRVLVRQDIPIRMSRLLQHLRSLPGEMAEEAARELESEAKICCPPVCLRCGLPNPDPVVAFDMNEDRAIYACPHCSSPEVRARWESEKLA